MPTTPLPELTALDHTWVEDEAIEHAHLDFVAMDLDLVVDNLVGGVKFLEGEEDLAHLELDQITMRLDARENDDRQKNSIVINNDQGDMCSSLTALGTSLGEGKPRLSLPLVGGIYQASIYLDMLIIFSCQATTVRKDRRCNTRML